MKTYTANWHIKRKGRMVEPGEQLELSDDDAKALGGSVSVVEVEDAEPHQKTESGEKAATDNVETPPEVVAPVDEPEAEEQAESEPAEGKKRSKKAAA